mmetsp:Transcript_13447/g.34488  ORF Transcript_13447/g.34488 Transcript_13447/m.34488 type:complete len:267 (+) Transcript_13447:358-1158(+)
MRFSAFFARSALSSSLGVRVRCTSWSTSCFRCAMSPVLRSLDSRPAMRFSALSSWDLRCSSKSIFSCCSFRTLLSGRMVCRSTLATLAVTSLSTTPSNCPCDMPCSPRLGAGAGADGPLPALVPAELDGLRLGTEDSPSTRFAVLRSWLDRLSCFWALRVTGPPAPDASIVTAPRQAAAAAAAPSENHAALLLAGLCCPPGWQPPSAVPSTCPLVRGWPPDTIEALRAPAPVCPRCKAAGGCRRSLWGMGQAKAGRVPLDPLRPTL